MHGKPLRFHACGVDTDRGGCRNPEPLRQRIRRKDGRRRMGLGIRTAVGRLLRKPVFDSPSYAPKTRTLHTPVDVDAKILFAEDGRTLSETLNKIFPMGHAGLHPEAVCMEILKFA